VDTYKRAAFSRGLQQGFSSTVMLQIRSLHLNNVVEGYFLYVMMWISWYFLPSFAISFWHEEEGTSANKPRSKWEPNKSLVMSGCTSKP
jgi:hypothetical protein